jgi:hypothetical protein
MLDQEGDQSPEIIKEIQAAERLLRPADREAARILEQAWRK